MPRPRNSENVSPTTYFSNRILCNWNFSHFFSHFFQKNKAFFFAVTSAHLSTTEEHTNISHIPFQPKTDMCLENEILVCVFFSWISAQVPINFRSVSLSPTCRTRQDIKYSRNKKIGNKKRKYWRKKNQNVYHCAVYLSHTLFCCPASISISVCLIKKARSCVYALPVYISRPSHYLYSTFF